MSRETQPSLRRRVASVVDEPRSHQVTLAGIVVISAVFNLFRLTSVGYGNTYYAAAVKNMRKNLHNFFFVSYDAGFVTVDKPPLGLWIQTISTWIFGFHGWAIMLPQAIAGVLSVVVLYFIVRRAFGSRAGLVAGLVLALTPIVVATSRNNTADMLVMFTVLIATWLLLRAADEGSLQWLAAATAVVGVGFNIKMMEAYLVLPAFYLVYFFGAQTSWRRRIGHLSVATVVLAVVSFAWATVVELTPASARPFIGSTDNDSIFSLIFGYNGIQRVLGRGSGGGGMGGGGMGGGSMFSHGAAGPLRLFNESLAGQISWLIPLAVIGAFVVGWRHREGLRSLINRPLDRQQRSLALFGMWFLTAATYFSVAGFFHRYYMVMLAPALAALVGIGVVGLWREYQRNDWRGWLLPVAFLVTAVVQAYILSSYPTYSQYLTPLVVGLTVVVAVALAVARFRPASGFGSYAPQATTLGVIALLLVPTVWAAFPAVMGTSSSTLPSAGPPTGSGFGGAGSFNGSAPSDARNGSAPGYPGPGNASAANGRSFAGGMGGMSTSGGGMGSTTNDSALVSYLEAHQGNATYLVAVDGGSTSTSSIIMATNRSVISLGGFSGSDPVMDVDELSNLVEQGKLKYVLLSGRGMGSSGGFSGNATGGMNGSANTSAGQSGGFGGGQVPNASGNSGSFGGLMGGSANSNLTNWVEDNCKNVSSGQWQSSSGNDGSSGDLYNCSVAADA